MIMSSSDGQTAAERLDRLRLIRTQNVGPVTFRQLLERYGSASVALKALPDLSRRGGRRAALKPCSASVAQREVDEMQSLGGSHLIYGDPGFPGALAAISDAPPVLCILGSPDLLNRPIIAIVGARNASTNGRRFAERLSHDLGAAELIVVSGMARGIDTAAHTGALATGTIAVLAGGPDVIYPRENTELYDSIREHGLIVSELQPGVEPLARHFPRRNRIISGLALGVIVVEAAARSGSLITARLAAEQGREVFAVPGSPLDPRAKGPNKLIRDGAILLESVEDVLEVLPSLRRIDMGEDREPGYRPPSHDTATVDETMLAKARAVIRENLAPTPIRIDDLVRDSIYSIDILSLVLLELELASIVERHPGGAVSLLSDVGND
jgi:DNA processing protein